MLLWLLRLLLPLPLFVFGLQLFPLPHSQSTTMQVWAEMVEGGIRPSAHAWCSRVNAHARAGRMRRALSLGREMRDQGHPWDVATYTSLIAGSTRKRNYSG